MINKNIDNIDNWKKSFEKIINKKLQEDPNYSYEQFKNDTYKVLDFIIQKKWIKNFNKEKFKIIEPKLKNIYESTRQKYKPILEEKQKQNIISNYKQKAEQAKSQYLDLIKNKQNIESQIDLNKTIYNINKKILDKQLYKQKIQEAIKIAKEIWILEQWILVDQKYLNQLQNYINNLNKYNINQPINLEKEKILEDYLIQTEEEQKSKLEKEKEKYIEEAQKNAIKLAEIEEDIKYLKNLLQNKTKLNKIKNYINLLKEIWNLETLDKKTFLKLLKTYKIQ